MNRVDKSCAGVTQLELLIGTAIALLLVAAMAHFIFGISSASSRLGEMSRDQLEARNDLELIAASLRRAGYRHGRSISMEEAFPAEGVFSAGSVVRESLSGLFVRYQSAGDAASRGCDGSIAAAGQTVTEVFFIHDGQLACRVNGGQDRQWVMKKLVTVATRLRVTYGLRTDANPGINQDTDAADVRNWQSVVRVRIQVLREAGQETLPIQVVALRNNLP